MPDLHLLVVGWTVDIVVDMLAGIECTVRVIVGTEGEAVTSNVVGVLDVWGRRLDGDEDGAKMGKGSG